MDKDPSNVREPRVRHEAVRQRPRRATLREEEDSLLVEVHVDPSVEVGKIVDEEAHRLQAAPSHRLRRQISTANTPPHHEDSNTTIAARSTRIEDVAASELPSFPLISCSPSFAQLYSKTLIYHQSLLSPFMMLLHFSSQSSIQLKFSSRASSSLHL